MRGKVGNTFRRIPPSVGGVLIGSVVAFWAVSFLLALVPGADWAYVIAAGLRDRTVLPAVGGLAAGYVALTAVVAAGLAALVARAPSVLTALTVLGAAYLVWLGAATAARPVTPRAATQAATAAMPEASRATSQRPDLAEGEGRGGQERGGEDGAPAWLRRVVRGAGISGLNPKALLLFLALLPQFATRGASWPFAAQIALLGLVHTANCALVYSGVGTASRRVLRARPSAARAVSRCSGAAMIVIGAALAAERLLR